MHRQAAQALHVFLPACAVPAARYCAPLTLSFSRSESLTDSLSHREARLSVPPIRTLFGEPGEGEPPGWNARDLCRAAGALIGVRTGLSQARGLALPDGTRRERTPIVLPEGSQDPPPRRLELSMRWPCVDEPGTPELSVAPAVAQHALSSYILIVGDY